MEIDSSVRVRPNIYALHPAGPEISALRAGVRAMKDTSVFPENDPRSWAYQAAIHGSFETPPDRQAQRSWNQCQHASFFFLSWHRMYIYFFESIRRPGPGTSLLELLRSGAAGVAYTVPRAGWLVEPALRGAAQ